MDTHRLLKGFNPVPDGESSLRHRTGTVSVVNSDGTVNLDLGGIVVPNVSVLNSAGVLAGDVVQVTAWAGDLLILGPVATNVGMWTTWTPSLTNITLGNGSQSARFLKTPQNTVLAHWEFLLGSSSAIGSDPRISLPVEAQSSYFSALANIGMAAFLDAGTASYPGSCNLVLGTPDAIRLLVWTAGGTYAQDSVINATIPITWGTSDALTFSAMYEGVP